MGKALLIKTSTLPSKYSVAEDIAEPMEGREERSVNEVLKFRGVLKPRDKRCVVVEVSSGAEESRRKMRWPWERRCRVSPRPMPRAAPVIR